MGNLRARLLSQDGKQGWNAPIRPPPAVSRRETQVWSPRGGKRRVARLQDTWAVPTAPSGGPDPRRLLGPFIHTFFRKQTLLI
jgi:hypothetical protein